MSKKIAVKLFGGLVRNYSDYFESMKTNLKKGNMNVQLVEYLSSLMLYTFLTFVSTIIIFVVLSITLMPTVDIAYSFTLSILLSSVCTGLVFFMGYYYPSIKAKGLKSHIDKSLPFAAFNMTTTSSAGGNPIQIFKVLSMRGGVMGEEGKKIYTAVTNMGLNLTIAMQKAAMNTPSTKYSDLLWGMITTITSGSDMEAYLSSKTRTLMAHYRRTLDEYSKQISLFTEIYITLVIVGTLFFIVLIAIIAPLAAISILFVQTFLVFFFVPLVSTGFIVLLKTISPVE